MRRLKSGNLFAAAAEIYRKRLLRSVPICDSSHRSLSTGGGFVMSRKPYQRKRLPAELSALENVVELSCHSAARWRLPSLFGRNRARFSDKSNEEVTALINFVKPQVVFVELCPDRAYMLEPREITFLRYVAKISLGELFSQFKGVPLRVHKEMDKKLVNVKDDAERAKIVVQAMNKMCPSFTETTILECRRYMSAKLLEVAREHNTVVAVVETVHLPGIQKHWKEPVDMKQLHSVPMGRNAIMMGIITIPIFMILRWWY
ncbi:hypothetical protein OROHE_014528 [Orobanche hederae]